MILALLLAATYSITPPVSGTQCPGDMAYPCYYVVTGDFTDTYQFTAEGAYSFEVTGNHWRKCTVSGHRICYVEDMTITWAAVVDAAGFAVELVDTDVDKWTLTVNLPPGNYTLVINGSVAGNRPGVYGYRIEAGP